ncbi:MAG: DUF2179 domain-containing protein [Anaerolineae bacterium]|jgi:uncharacterized protein YebE (UPF0316 family)|nr:DUF2179 domain-containing protein [Anaerolineae bacterium]
MEHFLATQSIWVVASIIFITRVLNMALDTIRMLTVVRGMRAITWILGVLQTITFVLALGSVMSDLDNPIKIMAYSVGFATGNVIGMMIEERLAFGFVNMTIISSVRGQALAGKLRSQGHAVTEIPARGKDGSVAILECSVQRKFAPEVQTTVLECDPNAFITTRDIQRVWRGYWRD